MKTEKPFLKQLIGKNLVDLLEEDTIALESTKFDPSSKKHIRVPIKENKREYELLKEFGGIKYISFVGEKDNVVVAESGDWVLVFKDEKLNAFFAVYENTGAHYDTKRNRVTATGHETNHEYWLEEDEYEVEHFR